MKIGGERMCHDCPAEKSVLGMLTESERSERQFYEAATQPGDLEFVEKKIKDAEKSRQRSSDHRSTAENSTTCTRCPYRRIIENNLPVTFINNSGR